MIWAVDWRVRAVNPVSRCAYQFVQVVMLQPCSTSRFMISQIFQIRSRRLHLDASLANLARTLSHAWNITLRF